MILRQCFGGEEVERRRQRIIEQGFHHRDVIAQRLPARRAGDDHHVVAGADLLDCLCLVTVEHLDPLHAQGILDGGAEPAGDIGILGRARREHLHVHDLPGKGGMAAQIGEKGVGIHQASVSFCCGFSRRHCAARLSPNFFGVTGGAAG